MPEGFYLVIDVLYHDGHLQARVGIHLHMNTVKIAMTEFNLRRASSGSSSSSFEVLSTSLEPSLDTSEHLDQSLASKPPAGKDGSTDVEHAQNSSDAEDHLGFAQPGALLNDQAMLECMTGRDNSNGVNANSQLSSDEGEDDKQHPAEKPSRAAEPRKHTSLPRTLAASKGCRAKPRIYLSALALGALIAWMILMSVILTACAAKTYRSQRHHAESLSQMAEELVDARLATIALIGSSRSACPGPSIAEYMQEQAIILQDIQTAIGKLSHELHEIAAETGSEVQLLEQVREILAVCQREQLVQLTKLIKSNSVKDASPLAAEATEIRSMQGRGLAGSYVKTGECQNVETATAVHPDPKQVNKMKQLYDAQDRAAAEEAHKHAHALARSRSKVQALHSCTTTCEEQEHGAAVCSTTKHPLRSPLRHLPTIVRQGKAELNAIAGRHLSSAVNAVVSLSKDMKVASHTVGHAITQATRVANQYLSTMAHKAMHNTITTTAVLHTKVRAAKSVTRKRLLPLHAEAQQLFSRLQMKAKNARQWVC